MGGKIPLTYGVIVIINTSKYCDTYCTGLTTLVVFLWWLNTTHHRHIKSDVEWCMIPSKKYVILLQASYLINDLITPIVGSLCCRIKFYLNSLS